MLDLVGRESIYQPEQTGLIFPEHVGSEYIGWLHFQTIWNQLVIDSPDMLD